MSHDYRDMMKKGVCEDSAPDLAENSGDGWKLLLGVLAVLLFLGVIVK